MNRIEQIGNFGSVLEGRYYQRFRAISRTIIIRIDFFERFFVSNKLSVALLGLVSEILSFNIEKNSLSELTEKFATLIKSNCQFGGQSLSTE